ncbi:MAG TPA: enolase C-terminal domain-like protein [Acidobacteriaceae bacterium]|jgi:L-alanine-DL-glutamate epimerase-like enolase superfamily enzyme|nr:enolase C-terminal domain-like protein [Acidobacteriaceae bacterium]
MNFSEPKITSTEATAYTIPTDAPEADGTFAWDSTTLIVVELACDGARGLGYTYSHITAAPLARELMKKHVEGQSPFDTNALFSAMRKAQRNYGRDGIAATALSAIDIALWDLKAKLMGKPLCCVLGQMRDGAPVYGSGGFTTYSDKQLDKQLGGWVSEGIPRVKMKIGTHPEDDLRRVKAAREAIGEETELFVDANGAYSRKQALRFAEQFAAECNVTWFEEPVSSDDLAGLHLLRNRAPAGMDIAAGEYGWTAMYLRNMVEAEAVDVIQADATRCGGVTGFMDAVALADAHPLPISAHCGPSVHLYLACAARPLRHVEYFHDHERIERMLFDGFRSPKDGVMYPDLSRPGMGLSFKHEDAERYRDNA